MNTRNKTARAPSLEESGERRYLYPVRKGGAYADQRRIVAWALILIFFLVPWIEVGGRPLLRLDIAGDKYWVLFQLWHQTDGIYFLAVPMLLILALFLVTAVRGRLWCGYACPQTVFLDWMIRPLEELLEGPAHQRASQSRRPLRGRALAVRALKHVLFVLCGALVGNTALMYFVPPTTVLSWMQSSPLEHPSPFLAMVGVTLIFYFDFSWFREQFCSFLCPYARIQSILLDDSSPVVHYKSDRGEPRGAKAVSAGDCIDCGLCVKVCPTGIDIRDGLQMECIQCMRCVDGCNRVMEGLGRPLGLIDFAPVDPAATRVTFRSVAYSIAILLVLSLVLFGWFRRPDVEVTTMRQPSSSVTVYADGRLGNLFQLRLTNRSGRSVPIRLQSNIPEIQFVCGGCRRPLEPYESRRTSLVVIFPRDAKREQARGQLAWDESATPLSLPLLQTERGRP